MQQRIAFVRSRDQTNIAYALSGQGPPLVRAGTWMTHVQYDWESVVWSHWLRFMSSRHTLVRYDPRGCGLSQAQVENITLEDWVDDLEAVVDHLELESFPLFGMSQGAAVAAEYAIRHPERVQHLTLYAPVVTGWRGRSTDNARQWNAFEELMRTSWGHPTMAFQTMFAQMFLPDSPPEYKQHYAELQRKSAAPEIASRFMDVLSTLRVFPRLKLVTVPTLVIQIARDQVVDPRSAIGIAAEIAGSEFVSIDSRNHVLLEHEPGWEQFKAAFAHHVPGAAGPVRSQTSVPSSSPLLEQLSKRELDILREIAKGRSNKQIAEQLFISEKTVRNHITNIFEKLGVTSRAQALILARESGL
jgi:pimeloyl-ACP methyl ester carboxylesterase/DNA-binding CsgD family transcriptional regulator